MRVAMNFIFLFLQPCNWLQVRLSPANDLRIECEASMRALMNITSLMARRSSFPLQPFPDSVPHYGCSLF
jgi:hypothetical protein